MQGVLFFGDHRMNRMLLALLCVLAAHGATAQADLLGFDPFSNKYYVFDRTTGSSAFAGTLTISGDTVTGCVGAALHPTTREIYAIIKTTAGASNRRLATVNRSTGVCTLVGPLGDQFASISFTSAGVLYGVTGDGATTPETLYTINTATAAPTLVTALGNGADGEVIAFNSNDGLMYHSSGNGTIVFETINLGTLAITNIPVTWTGETFGLVFDPETGNFLKSNISSVLSTLTPAGVETAGPTLTDTTVTPSVTVDARGLVLLPDIIPSTTSLNLGSTPQGTASTPVSFTVEGHHLWGNITITPPSGVVVSLTSSGGFGSSLNLTPTAGVVSTTTIYARIQASAPAGAVSGNIVLTTNGGDTENIAVTGTVTAPAPEMDVTRGASAIASAGTDTVVGAGTGVPYVLTYTITNSGSAALTITTPIAAPGTQTNCTASITTQPSASVAATGSTTLVVTVTPATAALFSCTISIGNNDANENPYTWTITGTATSPAPEMDVLNGATAIADGGTDALGNIGISVAQTVTYTIANTGSAALNLTGTPNLVVVTPGLNITSASVTAQPATSVATAGSTTFTVTYTVTAASAFDFTISIANNDANENPYNWTVSGTGTAAPEMNVARGATSVADGSTDALGSAAVSQATTVTYTITNAGSANLTITTPVTISGQTNCTVSVTTQPGTSVAAAGTTTLVLSVTPTAAGAFSFNVSITNNDANENPYNWTVSGTGTTGGGGGGGGDGGCTTGETGTTAGWLACLAAVALVLIRRRRLA